MDVIKNIIHSHQNIKEIILNRPLETLIMLVNDWDTYNNHKINDEFNFHNQQQNNNLFQVENVDKTIEEIELEKDVWKLLFILKIFKKLNIKEIHKNSDYLEDLRIYLSNSFESYDIFSQFETDTSSDEDFESSSNSSQSFHKEYEESPIQDYFSSLKRIKFAYNFIYSKINFLYQFGQILIFAIPRYNRIGKPNKIWDSCIMKYITENDTNWKEIKAYYVAEDPFNKDYICSFLLTNEKELPIYFYLTDTNLKDIDCKDDTYTDQIKLSNCYQIANKSMYTLRDGEMKQGNYACEIGILIIFDESKDNGDWKFSKICYFDEIYAKDIQTVFDPNKGYIYIMHNKSLTFIILHENNKTELKNTDGSKFRISFPGIYKISSKSPFLEEITKKSF